MLSDPNNGSVLHQTPTVGTVATYSCSNGFELKGEKARTCGGNGEWSGVEPTCTKSTTGGKANIAQGELRAVWCMNHLCNDASFIPSNANQISAGAFQGNINHTPPILKNGPAANVKRRFLVLGGAGVQGALPSASTIAN